MAIPTTQQAIDYTANLLASYGRDYALLNVSKVEVIESDDMVDVTFTYGSKALSGRMSVWYTARGDLYGEW